MGRRKGRLLEGRRRGFLEIRFREGMGNMEIVKRRGERKRGNCLKKQRREMLIW